MTMGIVPDLDEVLAEAGPFATQLGLGSVAGYCAGVALRTAGAAGLALAGGGFLALQGLQYNGYVAVDWRKVQRDALRAGGAREEAFPDASSPAAAASAHALDLARGLAARREEIEDALTFGLPSASGFALGVAYGFGGAVGKIAAATAAWTAGAPLLAAHAFAVSENVRNEVERRAPKVAEELRRRTAQGAASVGEAAWRAALVAAGDDLEKLAALRETAEAREKNGTARGGRPTRDPRTPAIEFGADPTRWRERRVELEAKERAIRRANRRRAWGF
jgi:uncharacterized membrane protein (Fun14 family)